MQALDGHERTVPIRSLGTELGSFRLPSPRAQQQMELSLKRHGQLTAVIAREATNDEAMQVIDGFKRLRAARALGVEDVRVQSVALDSAQAKVAILVTNAGRCLAELEEAWLVRSLRRDDRLDQPQIARLLGRHKSWVCRRLALAEHLQDSVEADLRLGLVTASAARELARLPAGNQRVVADAVIQQGLTCHQTARLVAEIVVTPPDAFECVLADVLDRLIKGPPSKAKARTRTPAEQLVADVAAITRIAGRLQARLLARPLSSFGEQASEVILGSVGELRPVLSGLAQTIDRSLEGDNRCNSGLLAKS